MALALSVVRRLKGNNFEMVVLAATPSGNYPAGGELMSSGVYNRINGAKLVDGWSFGKAGFVYQLDQANDKWMVYCNTAGGANAALGEHTAAAYAAGVSGDTIRIYLVFAK